MPEQKRNFADMKAAMTFVYPEMKYIFSERKLTVLTRAGVPLETITAIEHVLRAYAKDVPLIQGKDICLWILDNNVFVDLQGGLPVDKPDPFG